MAGLRIRSVFQRCVSAPFGSLFGSSALRPALTTSTPRPTAAAAAAAAAAPFSSSARASNWLIPREMSNKRSPKGRPRVSTGGSMRGTTVVWGDYGLRMVDRHRRLTTNHLRLAVDTIKQKFRGMDYQLYTRVAANISVAVSGNEVRMGKGKGSHDHWVAKVAVNQIVFELKTNVHEQVVSDACRVLGAKLPGCWAMAKKGDPPYVGMVPLKEGVSVESLMKPRRSVEDTQTALPIEAASPSSS